MIGQWAASPAKVATAQISHVRQLPKKKIPSLFAGPSLSPRPSKPQNPRTVEGHNTCLQYPPSTKQATIMDVETLVQHAFRPHHEVHPDDCRSQTTADNFLAPLAETARSSLPTHELGAADDASAVYEHVRGFLSTFSSSGVGGQSFRPLFFEKYAAVLVASPGAHNQVAVTVLALDEWRNTAHGKGLRPSACATTFVPDLCGTLYLWPASEETGDPDTPLDTQSKPPSWDELGRLVKDELIERERRRKEGLDGHSSRSPLTKSGAMVKVVVSDILAVLDKGEPLKKMHRSEPPGGYSDVGIHTGTKARSTSYPLARAWLIWATMHAAQGPHPPSLEDVGLCFDLVVVTGILAEHAATLPPLSVEACLQVLSVLMVDMEDAGFEVSTSVSLKALVEASMVSSGDVWPLENTPVVPADVTLQPSPLEPWSAPIAPAWDALEPHDGTAAEPKIPQTAALVPYNLGYAGSMTLGEAFDLAKRPKSSDGAAFQDALLEETIFSTVIGLLEGPAEAVTMPPLTLLGAISKTLNQPNAAGSMSPQHWRQTLALLGLAVMADMVAVETFPEAQKYVPLLEPDMFALLLVDTPLARRAAMVMGNYVTKRHEDAPSDVALFTSDSESETFAFAEHIVQQYSDGYFSINGGGNVVDQFLTESEQALAARAKELDARIARVARAQRRMNECSADLKSTTEYEYSSRNGRRRVKTRAWEAAKEELDEATEHFNNLNNRVLNNLYLALPAPTQDPRIARVLAFFDAVPDAIAASLVTAHRALERLFYFADSPSSSTRLRGRVEYQDYLGKKVRNNSPRVELKSPSSPPRHFAVTIDAQVALTLPEPKASSPATIIAFGGDHMKGVVQLVFLPVSSYAEHFGPTLNFVAKQVFDKRCKIQKGCPIQLERASSTNPPQDDLGICRIDGSTRERVRVSLAGSAVSSQVKDG